MRLEDLYPVVIVVALGYFVVRSVHKTILEAEQALYEEAQRANAAGSNLSREDMENYASQCPDKIEIEIDTGYNPYRDHTHLLDEEEVETELIQSSEVAREIADQLREMLSSETGEDVEVEFDGEVSLEEADAALGPDGDRVIFAITPTGKVVSSFFSEENMKLAKEIAEVEDKPLDDVLLETIAERYDMVSDEDE